MFKVLVVLCAISSVLAVEFQIENKNGGDVWIGVKGYEGKAHLNNGGFVLGSNQKVSIQAPTNWGGHFWARTWCDGNNHHCLTGDCGNKISCASAGWTPPATIADFTLDASGQDYYDISLVDGYNAILKIEPLNGSGDKCKTVSCTYHFTDDCPDDLKLDTEHGVIACQSACGVFNTDQYCCRNDYANADKCKPTDWSTNYAKYFKDKCPDVWTTGYDSENTVFSCTGAQGYLVSFGG